MNHQIDFGWFIFSPPGFVSFVLLTIANIAEVNRTPFDLPEAESEIIAGYHTEYSGMRFGLFFLAEYLSVFSVSCLGTLLFLGGGSLPFLDFRTTLSDNTLSYLVVNALTIGVFFSKVVLYIFLMFWVRATLPRMRVDQLMGFAWKMMVPLSILNIVIAAVWQEVVRGHTLNYIPTLGNSLLGWVITGVLEIAAIVFVFALNRPAKPAPPAALVARA